MVAIAFEVDHRVHHVLEGARPRDRAVLGDVPDQKHRHPALLREAEEPKPAFAHLGDAPRRRVEGGDIEGLNGVDDEERGVEPGHLGRDGVEIDLGLDPELGLALSHGEPFGAHLRLPRRFLARYVEDRSPRAAERAGQLERERRLSDARVASDQDQGAGHQPSSQNPVELADSGAPAILRAPFDLLEALRGGSRGRGAVPGAGRRGLAPAGAFAGAVPRAAVRAAAEPLGAFVPALGAEEHGLRLAGRALRCLPSSHGA